MDLVLRFLKVALRNCKFLVSPIRFNILLFYFLYCLLMGELFLHKLLQLLNCFVIGISLRLLFALQSLNVVFLHFNNCDKFTNV